MLDPRVHAHHASAFRPHSVQLAAQLAQLHLCEPHALHTATPGRMKSGEHENIHTHPKATGVGHGHLEGCACDHRWDSGWPPKARDLRARAVVLAYHEIEQRRVSGGAARRQRANQPQRRQVLNRHRLLLCDAGWACPQVGVSSRSRPPPHCLTHTHTLTLTHSFVSLSHSLTHTLEPPGNTRSTRQSGCTCTTTSKVSGARAASPSARCRHSSPATIATDDGR